eukprot:CFRG4542T1
MFELEKFEKIREKVVPKSDGKNVVIEANLSGLPLGNAFDPNIPTDLASRAPLGFSEMMYAEFVERLNTALAIASNTTVETPGCCSRFFCCATITQKEKHEYTQIQNAPKSIVDSWNSLLFSPNNWQAKLFEMKEDGVEFLWMELSNKPDVTVTQPTENHMKEAETAGFVTANEDEAMSDASSTDVQEEDNVFTQIYSTASLPTAEQSAGSGPMFCPEMVMDPELAAAAALKVIVDNITVKPKVRNDESTLQEVSLDEPMETAITEGVETDTQTQNQEIQLKTETESSPNITDNIAKELATVTLENVMSGSTESLDSTASGVSNTSNRNKKRRNVNSNTSIKRKK